MTRTPIIAFAGATKTGKTAVSKSVSGTFGCGVGSFGDVLRAEANARGIPHPNREDLQAIGEQFVDARCAELCNEVLQRAAWRPGQLAVLDGLRHVEVLQKLREIVAPQRVVVVLLEATVSERLARSTPMRPDLLKALDTHSTEIQVHTVIPTIADLRVGGRSLNETIEVIIGWIRSEISGESPKG